MQHWRTSVPNLESSLAIQLLSSLLCEEKESKNSFQPPLCPEDSVTKDFLFNNSENRPSAQLWLKHFQPPPSCLGAGPGKTLPVWNGPIGNQRLMYCVRAGWTAWSKAVLAVDPFSMNKICFLREDRIPQLMHISRINYCNDEQV